MILLIWLLDAPDAGRRRRPAIEAEGLDRGVLAQRSHGLGDDALGHRIDFHGGFGGFWGFNIKYKTRRWVIGSVDPGTYTPHMTPEM